LAGLDDSSRGCHGSIGLSLAEVVDAERDPPRSRGILPDAPADEAATGHVGFCESSTVVITGVVDTVIKNSETIGVKSVGSFSGVFRGSCRARCSAS
jgi:hypothetical protein